MEIRAVFSGPGLLPFAAGGSAHTIHCHGARRLEPESFQMMPLEVYDVCCTMITIDQNANDFLPFCHFPFPSFLIDVPGGLLKKQ